MDEIPDSVIRFVTKHISTLEQLEVLMLVSALPDREWTSTDVYQVVKSNPALVQRRLDEFVQMGMLIKPSPETYRFAPKEDELAKQVAQVTSLYKLSRHRLIELIYSPTMEEMRGFSQAFRFKKRE